MHLPRIPDNETARLQDLYAYGLLESGSERIFEEVAELAAVICGTRFAAVTLIDSDRQWIKSSHGMDLRDSSRDESVCGHAILESDVFEVRNIGADERFFDNPLLVGHPRIRFYAGSQLRSGRGNAIGMLCVLDSEPGELSENQRQALRQLSRLVMAILDARLHGAGTPQWLGSWIAGVTQEVYVRDLESLQYVFANEAALRQSGCTLAQLRAGEPCVWPEGDDCEFQDYVQRLRNGEGSLSFDVVRETAHAGKQRVRVSWSLLTTAEFVAILSVVHAV